MVNFPVEVKGETYWISRSCAVVGFVFCKDVLGRWCVLANKRGKGTPDYQGYWNCPCGYLDYDENAFQAIHREVWEETGLDVPLPKFVQYNTNTETDSNLQNVTIRHYAILNGTISDWVNFSKNNMETDEVDDIDWVNVEDIDSYKWAFGHNALIKDIYNRFVNIPWYKKLVKYIYNKLF